MTHNTYEVLEYILESSKLSTLLFGALGFFISSQVTSVSITSPFRPLTAPSSITLKFEFNLS